MADVNFSGQPNKGSVVKAAQPGDWTRYSELLSKQGTVDYDKLPDFTMTQQGSDKTWTFKVEAPKGQENNPLEWLFTRTDNKGAQSTSKPAAPAPAPAAPVVGCGPDGPPKPPGSSNTQTPLPSGVVKAMDGMASVAFVYEPEWQKWVAARKAESHGGDKRIKQWLQIMLDSIIYPESKGAYIEWMRKIGVPDDMLPSGGYNGEYRYASDADARGLKPAAGGQRLGADENGKGALQRGWEYLIYEQGDCHRRIF